MKPNLSENYVIFDYNLKDHFKIEGKNNEFKNTDYVVEYYVKNKYQFSAKFVANPGLCNVSINGCQFLANKIKIFTLFGKKRKTIRQTNRSGSLKSSIGSVDTENIYTPAEKLAASNPKLAAAPEASKLEVTKLKDSKTKASKPGTIKAMDFDALMNKQMEQFRNIMIISPQQIVSRLEQMWTQSEDRLDKIEDEFSSLLPAERINIKKVLLKN
ncbi:hypothetical protein H8356DRAFT_1355511 [Neocallimastix lanati (nom. inval.)]|nr:hypothetical protein H8356DRAFT_1355511 [Neocallimastix sp. JGI-2020a]